MTWPINSGKDFKGVYNLHDKTLLLFTANTKGVMKILFRSMISLINCWNKRLENMMRICFAKMLN
jgi:peptide subunit release factor RF-3